MLYEKEHLQEISFPLGGIGTGCIGLAGNGRLFEWEIFNRPAKGVGNGYSCILVRLKDKQGRQYLRVLQGDESRFYSGMYIKNAYGGFGHGLSVYSLGGCPHFRNCTFSGEIPFAKLTFTDEDFPGTVVLTAFNPMIPGQEDDSSIPGAFFEISYENKTGEEMELSVFFVVKNPFPVGKNSVVSEFSGIRMENAQVSPNQIGYGDLTVATDATRVCIQEAWSRKGGLQQFWRELETGEELTPRHYDTPGSDHCCLMVTEMVGAGAEGNVRYVLTWNVPNQYNYWDPVKDSQGQDVIWRNYYATMFRDSAHTAKYCMENWERLYEESAKFREILHGATMERVVIDAASANLAVLKSPTVMRLENGELYGWEGVNELAGSCRGTCQHVWNYAYALCFLFPKLERSIRDLEFRYTMDEDGQMQFRLTLPLGRERMNVLYPGALPCVDGQMGAVIKTYREWKISGDDEWLRKTFSMVKKALSYAWSEKNFCQWDRNRDGVLEGRQHHTLDRELFGPSAWLQGFYLAALKAAGEMAEYLGEKDVAKEYRELFESGKKFVDEELFNGSYYFQKVDIHDKAVAQRFGVEESYWNEETEELTCQIAQGCEIDQLCGQWHANLCGLGEIFDKKQTKIALESLYRNNFYPSLRGLVNLCRIYGVNDESGAVICTYPDGAYKPVHPIPYCDESMHGFEYALAGLMISEGMVQEGVEIVRGIRNRYNGANRNPWNEMECGSNYARSMASFALIPIFSGFSFDMPRKTIGFSPIGEAERFFSLWSLDCGWGSYEKTAEFTKIRIEGGELTANTFRLPYLQEVTQVWIDGKQEEFSFRDGVVRVYADAILRELVVEGRSKSII